MKKTITRSYEATVCDICGHEEDYSINRLIKKCPVCRKDMCSFCEVVIRFAVEKNGHFTSFEKRFCKEHLSSDFLLALAKGV